MILGDRKFREGIYGLFLYARHEHCLTGASPE